MNLSVKVRLSMLLLIILSASAGADVNDNSAFVHKTADYYEGSPRKLLESMGPREQDRYAATGRFDCPSGGGTAQLTIKNDIITTAGHIFLDRKTCKLEANVKDCKFAVKTPKGTVQIPVQEMLGSGFKCPGEQLPVKSEKDWVILKLKFPVEGVKPYEIDENRAANLQEGDGVVVIGHSLDFGGRLTDKNRTLASHYGTCKVDHVYGKYLPFYFSAPCGCSEGCSGGGALTEGDNPSIFGILHGGFETQAELDAAIKRGRSNTFHADPKTRDTYFVPITGEFLKTLKQVTSDRDI